MTRGLPVFPGSLSALRWPAAAKAVKARGHPAETVGVQGSGHRPSDGGFTLIELGVALLIVGILVSLAIPTYLGFSAQTRDKQMQADLLASIKVQALLYLEQGAFSADEAVLLPLEPTLQYSAAGASGAVTVLTRDPATAGVCLFGLSLSGRWFAVHYSGYGAVHFAEAAPEPCTAGLVAGWSLESW